MESMLIETMLKVQHVEEFPAVVDDIPGIFKIPGIPLFF